MIIKIIIKEDEEDGFLQQKREDSASRKSAKLGKDRQKSAPRASKHPLAVGEEGKQHRRRPCKQVDCVDEIGVLFDLVAPKRVQNKADAKVHQGGQAAEYQIQQLLAIGHEQFFDFVEHNIWQLTDLVGGAVLGVDQGNTLGK